MLVIRRETCSRINDRLPTSSPGMHVKCASYLKAYKKKASDFSVDFLSFYPEVELIVQSWSTVQLVRFLFRVSCESDLNKVSFKCQVGC